MKKGGVGRPVRRAAALGALGTILATTGCSSPKTLQPEAAQAAFVSPAPENPISTVALPVQLSFSALEKELNSQFTGVLYDDPSFENDNVQVKVTKAGAFKLAGFGDTLSVTAPLNVYVKGKYAPGGVEALAIEKDLTIKPIVTLVTRVRITPDWKMETQTVARVKWAETPQLVLGPLKIPIQSLLDAVLRKQGDRIGKEIDVAIAQQLNVRKEMEKAWKSAFAPMELDKEYGAYLVMTPMALGIEPLRADGRSVHTGATLQAKVEVITGATAPPKAPAATPLPRASAKLPADKGFSTTLAASIPYALLESEMQKAFAEEPFDFPDVGRRLLIDAWSFVPQGDRIRVGLDFRALKLGKDGKPMAKKPMKGRVYLTAAPVVNLEKREVAFADVKFELKSKNALVGAAAWMLNGKIEKELASQTFSFAEYLDEYKRVADGMLQGYPLGAGMQIRGSMKKLEVVKALPTPDALVVYIVASGQLELRN
jgi:hypothetical protein